LTTIAIPLATLLTVIAKVLMDQWHLKMARRDLAADTALTKQAKDAAAAAAVQARQAVNAAQVSAAETKETLNGGLDLRIQAAVEAAVNKTLDKREGK